MSQLLATKPLDAVVREAAGEGEVSLHRVLGRWDLVALGIGAVIGAGIFIITGSAAARFAGPVDLPLLRPRGDRMCPRRIVLCRVRDAHSRRGLCLHLRLCDPR